MDKQMMTEIIEQEGNESIFYIKEYKCEALRQETFEFWCGYISRKDGKPLSDVEREIFDTFSIGGTTYNGEHLMGFDCGHHGQLVPGFLTNPILEAEDKVSPMDYYVTLRNVEDVLEETANAMNQACQSSY